MITYAAPDDPEVGRTLDSVAELLSAAMDAIGQVRHHAEVCWPTKPSFRALDTPTHDLCKSCLDLVDGSRWKWGSLTLLIGACHATLNSFGWGELSDVPDLAWAWSQTGVDHLAPAHPDPATAAALRDALTGAQTTRDAVSRQLDEVILAAPPERWLPQWGLDDARAYIAAIGGEGRRKWQHSVPPMPLHRYTVRDWRPELRQEFLAFAQLIQRTGDVKTWGGYVDAYLEVDGFEYWTNGWRITETTVINRVPAGSPEDAKPVAALTPNQLRLAVERRLATRRSSEEMAGRTGVLDQRIRALLAAPDVR